MNALVVVKVLVVNEAKEILTLRRSPTAPRRAGQWDFPGGWAEDGEDFALGAVRETEEEAGIAIKRPALVYGTSHLHPEHGTVTHLLFVAPVTGQPEVTLSFEHDAFAWMTPDKLLTELQYDKHIDMIKYAQPYVAELHA